MENCLLCHNELSEKKECDSDLKLLKLCHIYLHSSITEKASFRVASEEWKNLPFCSKCFESATGLQKLSQQLQCIQKSVSEFTFTFALEILHRRGKVKVDEDKHNSCEFSKQKLVEFDVSAFQNENFSNQLIFDCSEAELLSELTQEPISESVDEIDPLSIPVMTEEVNASEITFEKIKIEDSEQLAISDCMQFEDIKNQSIPETNTSAKTATDIEAFRMQCLKNRPALKLSKLRFAGYSKQRVMVEASAKSGNSRGSISKTLWTRMSPRGSYRIAKLLDEKCNATEGSRIIQSTSMSIPSSSISPQQDDRRAAKKTVRLSSKETSVKVVKGYSIGKSRVKSAVDDNTTEKPFQCNICKKLFNLRRNMVNHLRIHKVPPRHKCEYCDKIFRKKFNLQTHVRTHTGEKPFHCSFCPRSFTRSVLLNNHIKALHPGERPFKCSLCEMAFLNKNQLNKHTKILIRDGKQGSKCPESNCSALNQNNFLFHTMYKHNSNFKYKCRECEKCFKTLSLAEMHYKRVHFALDFSEDCIIQSA